MTGEARIVFALLLCCVGCLLLLDRRREAEIADLAVRLGNLAAAQGRGGTVERPPADVAPEPVAERAAGDAAVSPVADEIHPLIRATLQAHTDGELSEIGGQQ